MAFTTMAIIALTAYAASKTAADIIAAKRAKAASDAADAAAKTAAATAANTPPAPPAPTPVSASVDAAAATTAMETQRKRAASGDTLLSGPPRVGTPEGVAAPKTLLGY